MFFFNIRAKIAESVRKTSCTSGGSKGKKDKKSEWNSSLRVSEFMKKGCLHSEEQCFTVEGILFMGIEICFNYFDSG